MYKLERNLLKDQAAKLLRDHIISGQFPPGTRLTERELAEQFGISRAPIHDALLELEKEELIVTKPDGRYLMELSEQDIRGLYQVRLTLEKLAVELATKNTSPENRAALRTKLREMEESIAGKDYHAFTMNDMEMHRLVWVQANNPYLLKALNTLAGPIFMFIAQNARHVDIFAAQDAGYVDWNSIIKMHEDLVTCINSGDVLMAVKSVERNMGIGLHSALNILEVSCNKSGGGL